MKNILISLTFVVLFLLGYCQSKTGNVDNDSSHVIEKTEQHFDSFFKSPLDTIVYQYIMKVDGHFFSKDWLYYSLYFFEEDSTHYFTMWAFTLFPDYISECIDTNNFNFYFVKYLQRNIVVMSKSDNELISPSKESIELANLEKEREFRGDNYSGPWYFETYRIIKEKDTHMIIKNDSIINDFLDCLQIMDVDIEIDDD